MSLLSPQTWTRTIDADTFITTTDQTLFSHDFVHAAFSSPAMYWVNDVPESELGTLIANSCCFGVYLEQADGSRAQIGMARLVTDYVSVAYLTDVYIHPSYQGRGLGVWLIKCTNDFVSRLPRLRGIMLLASVDGPAKRFYAREMGMRDLAEEGLACMARDGPGAERPHGGKYGVEDVFEGARCGDFGEVV